jgi:hypothetical protein
MLATVPAPAMRDERLNLQSKARAAAAAARATYQSAGQHGSIQAPSLTHAAVGAVVLPRSVQALAGVG